MDKKKPTATDKTGGAGKAEQASAIPKDANPRRRINVKMVQNVLLIWLDSNIDDNNADCLNTVSKLQRVVNSINTFTDGDQCIEFINSMNDEKACMVISGALGQHIVPRVHNLSQVDSTFIFCGNKKRHEEWAKDWSKVKGVFTEIGPICDALKEAAQQCEQNSIAISFMATNDAISNKNLNQLDCSFMYTQIMKDILLTIKFGQVHIQEFIDYCLDAFADNEAELKNVKELQRKYHQKTPIWWYTCEGFLYPMLNRALRLMDADVIINMGFFIGDLHRHITQLHAAQFNGTSATFTVYRGQGMSRADFEQMKKMKGGLLSFNNFLSTSTKRNVSLPFAHGALSNPDLVGVLFVMVVDPSISTTPFASVVDVSCFKTEDEILFSMHTVFRIGSIKPMGENPRLYQVELSLTSDNDPDLRALTDRMREETKGSTGWDQLGQLLRKMGQPAKAQQIYEIMLQQPSNNDRKKAYIYHQLGWMKDDQGEYEEAIAFYEKSLKIRLKTLPPNDPALAPTYNNMGNVYDSMGDYPKALSYYEKALAIRQQSLPPNHPSLATSYNNIGSVYYNMGDYSKALSSHEKALKIRLKTLPPNHPDLAPPITTSVTCMTAWVTIRKHFRITKKDLEISQKTLPPNHPDLAMSYGNMGIVYDNMGDYPKALSSHEKALAIQQQSLPPNHPDLATTTSYNNG